jgi:hypothetical protein
MSTLTQLLESQLKADYARAVQVFVQQTNQRIASLLRAPLHPAKKQVELLKIKQDAQTRLTEMQNQLTANLEKLRKQSQAVAAPPASAPPAVPAASAPAPNITLTVTPARAGVKKALLVGCDYIGTPSQLNGCINDVNNIKNKLTTLGFDAANIQVLTDKTAGLLPTKANILATLTRFLVAAEPNDILFFEFSGHGSYTYDQSGDETDGQDEMIVPLDFQYIKDDDLKSVIQKNLKSGVTLFALFDSCHSGSVLDLRFQYFDTENLNMPSVNTKQLETPGQVVMISGCMDRQTSADAYVDAQFQGAMTWAFLRSTKGKTSITWRELLLTMRSNLSGSKFSQIPQLSAGQSLDLDAKICLM